MFQFPSVEGRFGNVKSGCVKLNAWVRSPVIALLQGLILLQVKLNLFSKNFIVEEWSAISLYTYPPLVQGDMIMSGTLNPSPIGFPAGWPNYSSFVISNIIQLFDA